ncbi:MAG: diadenylate cyclase CdaA [Lachnospiraceae bacterium]|nr:diadenylate cyclase CdaA [Lachnospiraceae bacterium]MDD7701859.1 diadenylate cyclase CdaA [Lachnospiraceae bacterium]MDY3301181.1 diadenylate cyclase CdaA [Lachnospiraceae bacterium]
MSDLFSNISAFLNDYFGASLPNVHVTDVIEILIIAFFIYQFLKWIKNTRAWVLFKGIAVIAVFFIIAALFRMSTILWLGSKLLNAGIIALIVVFQPELRRALERLGRQNFFHVLFSLGFGRGAVQRFDDHTKNDLVKAAYEMGAVKTGALIVIERDVQLEEYVRTGINVDAILTRQLLINIFEKNTPLHDGAVIVRGDRVVSATCYLPLTDSNSISKDLGTRHRAAIGISEVSDALTIVVSEETGKISVTMEGELRRDLSPDELLEALTQIQYAKGSEDAEEEKKQEGEQS